VADNYTIEILKLARAIAGGVSQLAAKLDIDVYVLDEMLHGVTEVPPWVAERAQDFIRQSGQNR